MSVLAKLASLACLGFFKSTFTLITSFDCFLYFIKSEACFIFSLLNCKMSLSSEEERREMLPDDVLLFDRGLRPTSKYGDSFYRESFIIWLSFDSFGEWTTLPWLRVISYSFFYWKFFWIISGYTNWLVYLIGECTTFF